MAPVKKEEDNDSDILLSDSELKDLKDINDTDDAAGPETEEGDEEEVAKPSPKKKTQLSTDTARKKTDTYALVMELAKAYEKGGKPNWDLVAQESGFMNAKSAQTGWSTAKKRYEGGSGSKNSTKASPLKPKPAKVTKPRASKKKVKDD